MRLSCSGGLFPRWDCSFRVPLAGAGAALEMESGLLVGDPGWGVF